MDIISYIHKSVELLFQILGLVEVWAVASTYLPEGVDYPLHQRIGQPCEKFARGLPHENITGQTTFLQYIWETKI